jgi:L-rhamnose isomerase
MTTDELIEALRQARKGPWDAEYDAIVRELTRRGIDVGQVK